MSRKVSLLGQHIGTMFLKVARKPRQSFGLIKKQEFTAIIQLWNRSPLRQSTFHLPAAYPRIDLAALIQMDPQRFGITGRLSLAYHRCHLLLGYLDTPSAYR